MGAHSLASNAILAKSRAMYGRRLTERNYADLLACHSVPEVAAYLKTRTAYADALASITPQAVHRQQLEILLNRRLFDQYAALCRYEMSIGHDFYHYFIIKCDVQEILSCLRYMNGGGAGEYLYALPAFMQKHSRLDLYRLAAAHTLADLAAALEGTPYQELILPFARNPDFSLEEDGTLEIEAVLTRYVYGQLRAIAREKLQGRDMQEVLELLQRSSDLEAIVNIYRLKRMLKADRLYIGRRVFMELTALSPKQIDLLLDAADGPDFLARLRTTPYGRELDKVHYDYIEEGIGRIQHRWHLKRLRFSTNPSVVMFCYIYLAENEIRNITHIIEGVRYRMTPEEIGGRLIGAG